MLKPRAQWHYIYCFGRRRERTTSAYLSISPGAAMPCHPLVQSHYSLQASPWKARQMAAVLCPVTSVQGFTMSSMCFFFLWSPRPTQDFSATDPAIPTRMSSCGNRPSEGSRSACSVSQTGLVISYPHSRSSSGISTKWGCWHCSHLCGCQTSSMVLQELLVRILKHILWCNPFHSTVKRQVHC